MSRILVTRAGGFPGAHVARHLAGDGHEVVALGRSAAALECLKDAPVSAVSCDLVDERILLCHDVEDERS
jgi:nucleoside-diphosphate-sugar epimerase